MPLQLVFGAGVLEFLDALRSRCSPWNLLADDGFAGAAPQPAGSAEIIRWPWPM